MAFCTELEDVISMSSVEEVARQKLAPFSALSGDESYQSRELEKASQQVAKNLYDTKVQPTTLLPKQVGNMYTASLYAAFASLIHNKHSSLMALYLLSEREKDDMVQLVDSMVSYSITPINDFINFKGYISGHSGLSSAMKQILEHEEQHPNLVGFVF